IGLRSVLTRVLPLPLLLLLLLLLLAVVPSCHGCPDKCLCFSQTVKCQNQDLDAIPHSLPSHIKSLFVTGNNIPPVDAKVFDNLPNLVRLDLSNNRIQNFSERAFPHNNTLRVLNLSRSFHNYFFTDGVLNGLLSGNLIQLTVLDLSSNDILFPPENVSASLLRLVSLNLQNSSIISILNGTLKAPSLQDLDLRDNSLRNLPATTLAELGLKPGLRLWDHMEGYHYRYEINSDPRLANLSINSDA
uniref:LRRNT domain-containing protein n=1 Tax=Mola mola TaxID=94237 RepID=A0A3Q3XCC1_MOLML